MRATKSTVASSSRRPGKASDARCSSSGAATARVALAEIRPRVRGIFRHVAALDERLPVRRGARHAPGRLERQRGQQRARIVGDALEGQIGQVAEAIDGDEAAIRQSRRRRAGVGCGVGRKHQREVCGIERLERLGEVREPRVVARQDREDRLGRIGGRRTRKRVPDRRRLRAAGKLERAVADAQHVRVPGERTGVAFVQPLHQRRRSGDECERLPIEAKQAVAEQSRPAVREDRAEQVVVGYRAHQDLVAPDVGRERHRDHLIAGRRWCGEVVVERGENLAFRIARLVHRPYDLADDERARQIGTEPQPWQQLGPSPGSGSSDQADCACAARGAPNSRRQRHHPAHAADRARLPVYSDLTPRPGGGRSRA